MRRGTHDPPTMDELAYLNSWPEGSVGYSSEQVLISQLLDLCKQHVFGRVPQLTQCIYDIWRDPKQAEHYQRVRDHLMDNMEKAREFQESQESP